MTVIDDHLAGFDAAQRKALSATVAVIRTALPGAVEVISYGMPTFKAGDAAGPAIVGLDGFTAHNSLFPYSTGMAGQFADELAAYPQTKGSIHFDRDRPFPGPLLRRILAARIVEINASYPRKNGEMREYDATGRLRLSGRMSGDVRTGTWRWYRKDGSIERSGSYRRGEPTGEWISYDRQGSPQTVEHR